MELISIKEKLHQYIDAGDDRLLNLLYVLAKEYNNDDDTNEFIFSEDEIKLLEDRRENRVNGNTRLFTPQEARNIIEGKSSL